MTYATFRGQLVGVLARFPCPGQVDAWGRGARGQEDSIATNHWRSADLPCSPGRVFFFSWRRFRERLSGRVQRDRWNVSGMVGGGFVSISLLRTGGRRKRGASAWEGSIATNHWRSADLPCSPGRVLVGADFVGGCPDGCNVTDETFRVRLAGVLSRFPCCGQMVAGKGGQVLGSAGSRRIARGPPISPVPPGGFF